jgi:hypothetical protein
MTDHSTSIGKAPVATLYIVGGEDGPRKLVTPEHSIWKYVEGKFSRVKHQAVENAVTLLGHSAVGLNGLLHLFGGRRGGTMGEGEESNELYVLRDRPEGCFWELVVINGVKPAPRSYHACGSVGQYV